MPRPRKIQAEASLASRPDAFLASLTAGLLHAATPKSTQIYEIIRDGIVQLQLPPGATINEKEICDRLSVSRTPLREALLQLATENLVTIVPSTGTRVAPIHVQDAFDGQLVRDALEARVVRLAAMRMTPESEQSLSANMQAQRDAAAMHNETAFYRLDEEFHRLICGCGASPHVWRIINGAKAQLDRIRRLDLSRSNQEGRLLAQHQAIFNALMQRDAERAVQSMQVHLSLVFETIRSLIIEHRDYFSDDTSEFLSRLNAP